VLSEQFLNILPFSRKYMRELREGEVVIQVWSSEDPSACRLGGLVSNIVNMLRENPQIGVYLGTEGPTFHIPDFFSNLYGSTMGYLIYVKTPELDELKKRMMKFEMVDEVRVADIDIYLDYFKKIYRASTNKD
jgi:hypothetical protein